MASDAQVRKHILQPSWTQSTYRDRYLEIRPLLIGRSVLDLGAGSGFRRDDWFHQMIQTDASEAVGIELSQDFVDGARAKGVDLVHGDAESIRLGRQFDVVFAGELIEHLSSFTGLLDTAKAHLRPGGVPILTTPNAFAVSNFVYRFGGRARVHAEHTCWFCEDTLKQLLERHGFKVTTMRFLGHSTPGRARKMAAGTVRLMLPDRLAKNTLLAVAELP
jgi:2-polyprenyl-3-methyl-5-hydroxy-6-metoxy-1,4-benzoquinol methylase